MTHTRPEIDAGIASALRAAKATENSGAVQFVDAFNELRRRIVLALAEAGPLSPMTAEAIKANLGDMINTYQDRIAGLLTENQRRLFIKGLQVVDAAAQGSGIHHAVPYLSESVLDQARSFGAELVTNILNDARARIATEISLAAMGQKPMESVISAIGSNLDDPSIFGTIATRAETIYRTEVNRMQSLAAVDRMQQVQQQIPDLQKRWLHSHVGIPRPGHLALDNVTIPASEQFVLRGADGETYEIDGPHDPGLPVGEVVNCFTGDTPVDARDIMKAYRSEYSGELVTIETTSGHYLTGTPNHPILTPRGFVPLGSLQEGDNVLCSLLGNGVTVTDPDVAYVPATLQQIFDTAAALFHRERILGSPVDFYGDGPESEIEIISTNRELMDTRESSLPQPSPKENFVRCQFGERLLPRQSLLVQFFFRCLHTAARNVRSMREFSTIRFAESTHSQEGRLGHATDVNSGFKEPSPNGKPRDSYAHCKGLFGFSGEISSNDHFGIDPKSHTSQIDSGFNDSPSNRLVRDVEVTSDFVGGLSSGVTPEKIAFLRRRKVQAAHVYTLQTVSGLYNNNGIICRNCKCLVVPIVGRFKAE